MSAILDLLLVAQAVVAPSLHEIARLPIHNTWRHSGQTEAQERPDVAGLALSGPLMVAAEPLDSSRKPYGGSLLTFAAAADGSWRPSSRLRDAAGGEHDNFGCSVAMRGDLLAVGSYTPERGVFLFDTGTPAPVQPAQAPAASPPRSWQVDELAVAAAPRELAVGSDGTVWLSHQRGFARLRPRGQAVEVVELPAARGSFGAIVVLEDGILLGDQDSPEILKVRLDPTTKRRLAIDASAITRITAPLSSAHGLHRAADGTLWVAGYCDGRVARREPSGSWHSYTLGGCVEGIASTRDGGVFVANYGSNAVHLLDRQGGARTFPLGAPCHPHTITVAPNGHAFAGCHAGGIVEVSADGVVRRHNVGEPSMVLGIDTDARGRVWFAASAAHRIGLLENRAISWVAPATPNGYPFGLAVAADGSVWYSLHAAGKVGHIR